MVGLYMQSWRLLLLLVLWGVPLSGVPGMSWGGWEGWGHGVLVGTCPWIFSLPSKACRSSSE